MTWLFIFAIGCTDEWCRQPLPAASWDDCNYAREYVIEAMGEPRPFILCLPQEFRYLAE